MKFRATYTLSKTFDNLPDAEIAGRMFYEHFAQFVDFEKLSPLRVHVQEVVKNGPKKVLRKVRTPSDDFDAKVAEEMARLRLKNIQKDI